MADGDVGGVFRLFRLPLGIALRDDRERRARERARDDRAVLPGAAERRERHREAGLALKLDVEGSRLAGLERAELEQRDLAGKAGERVEIAVGLNLDRAERQ